MKEFVLFINPKMVCSTLHFYKPFQRVYERVYRRVYYTITYFSKGLRKGIPTITYSSKGLWEDILLSPTYLWVYGEVYTYYLPLQWFMEEFSIVTFPSWIYGRVFLTYDHPDALQLITNSCSSRTIIT